MGLTFEQPNSVNEGVDVEQPKDERAPVQRLVIWHFINVDCRNETGGIVVDVEVTNNDVTISELT